MGDGAGLENRVTRNGLRSSTLLPSAAGSSNGLGHRAHTPEILVRFLVPLSWIVCSMVEQLTVNQPAQQVIIGSIPIRSTRHSCSLNGRGCGRHVRSCWFDSNQSVF